MHDEFSLQSAGTVGDCGAARLKNKPDANDVFPYFTRHRNKMGIITIQFTSLDVEVLPNRQVQLSRCIQYLLFSCAITLDTMWMESQLDLREGKRRERTAHVWQPRQASVQQPHHQIQLGLPHHRDFRNMKQSESWMVQLIPKAMALLIHIDRSHLHQVFPSVWPDIVIKIKYIQFNAFSRP